MQRISTPMAAVKELLQTPPIPYYPALARALAGINDALMLAQLMYWSDRTTDPDGWIWKRRDDWERELGMSRRQQETARSHLHDLGVVEERVRGVPPRLEYRIDWAKIIGYLGGSIPRNGEINWRETAQLKARNVPINLHETRQSLPSETTDRDYSETTTVGPSESLGSPTPEWATELLNLTAFARRGVSPKDIADIERDFPGIRLEVEARSFVAWWRDGRKHLQRPIAAWRAWLRKCDQHDSEGVAGKVVDPLDAYRKSYGRYLKPQEAIT